MGWEYKIGDCINHTHGSMTAVVLGRTRTLAGSESYSVRLVDTEDKRRDRVIRAEYMERIAFMSKPCVECRLRMGGYCYRDGS